MNYFIADTHFNDETILNYYANRPFKNCKEMEEYCLKHWTNMMTSEDTLFVLGDVGDSFIWHELQGYKILIRGNHDLECWQYYNKMGFDEAYDYPIIKDEFMMLSHKPLYVNRNMPYGNIFGHVHDNPMYKTYTNQSACVCACRHNFQLVSEDEIMVNIEYHHEKK